MRSSDNKITTMVLAALLTALTLLCTFMFKIPIGMSGYIHLGDAIMFLGVIILPRRYACFAGPVGAALADIFGGFAVWAPWTFFIKLASVIVFGFALDFVKKDGTAKKVFGVPVAELIGYILAIVIGVCGYYAAEGVIYGNWIAPVVGVPMNIIQITAGAVVCVIVSFGIIKSGLKCNYRR